jgi:hypothetical protein
MKHFEINKKEIKMTVEEKNIAMKTSRSSGASALNKDGSIRAVVPLFIEKNVDKNKIILDFGAGKGATSTKYLLSKGFDVAAYDLWVNEGGDELLDKYALDRQYDVVFASNVLNVQSSLQMLCETLRQINSVLKYGGEFICNYPSTPRKMKLDAWTLKGIIEGVFDAQVELVGGTANVPIWRIRKTLS